MGTRLELDHSRPIGIATSAMRQSASVTKLGKFVTPRFTALRVTTSLFRRRYFFAAALALVACSPASEQPAANQAVPANAIAPATPAAPVETEAPKIVLRGDGLLVEEPGRGTPLAFDRTTPAEAEQALAGLGSAKRSTSSSECPPGQLDYLDYPNGLQLAFQNGKLVGWWADEEARGVATADGIRPGSPRSAIGSAEVVEVSYGKVFTIDEVNGLLDEQTASRVDALWSGLACIFH